MKYFKRLNQRGDTIAEVLVCLAILSSVLTAAFVLTNKNQSTSQASQERSTAVALANTQLESLRAFTDDRKLPAFDWFCMKPGDDPATTAFVESVVPVPMGNPATSAYPTDCRSSVAQDGSRYSYVVWSPAKAVAIGGNGKTFAVTTRWEGPINPSEEVKIFYSLFDTTNAAVASNSVVLTPAAACSNGLDDDGDGFVDFLGGFAGGLLRPPDLGCDLNPAKGSEVNAQCQNFIDDDGDGLIDLLDLGCDGNPKKNSEINPPCPLNFSVTDYTFPAWHLYNTGGVKRFKTFTMTNPANCGPYSTGVVTLSDTTNFSTIGNTCSNRTIASGASCTVSVQFYPPSGGGNDTFANSGVRSTMVTVANNQGFTAAKTTMRGRAVSDRMVPNNIMYEGQSIRGYDPACYNNAEACGPELRLSGGNVQLIVGGSVVWAINVGGQAYALAMQGDGNLVVYNSSFTPLWYTQLYGGFNFQPGDWLMLYSNGYLNHMRASGANYFNYWPFGAYY